MAISGSTAILIGISSFLRLPEKSSFFSFQKARYDRLQSHIQTELITPSGRDPQEVVNDVRAQYSNLEENYIYAIPRYVSSSYRDMVANRNIAVPIICNGFDNFENNIDEKLFYSIINMASQDNKYLIVSSLTPLKKFKI